MLQAQQGPVRTRKRRTQRVFCSLQSRQFLPALGPWQDLTLDSCPLASAYHLHRGRRIQDQTDVDVPDAVLAKTSTDTPEQFLSTLAAKAPPLAALKKDSELHMKKVCPSRPLFALCVLVDVVVNDPICVHHRPGAW